MIEIAMVDDENSFIERLKSIIESATFEKELFNINTYNSGEELINDFPNKSFDIIILDIEMNGISGIETSHKIRETDKNVIIAFLTSHQEFAIQGYEVNAFRYMLKSQPEHMYVNQLRSIFEEYHQKHILIPIKANDTIYNVAVDDIMYYEIYKRTIIVHLKDKNLEFGGKLSVIEEDERLINFIKPHKSYYVNLNYIDNITSTEIVMKNGTPIPLSRNLKQIVTKRFVSFLAERC